MFTMPFGPQDPSSLPMLLRQQMIAGQAPGPLPLTTLTPGYHAGGGMGGMGMPQQQAPQGFSMGDGAGMLSAGLAGFKPQQKPGLNPNGMPEDQSLGGAVAGINALQPGADGKFAQPPMPAPATDLASMQPGLWDRLGLTGPKGLF